MQIITLEIPKMFFLSNEAFHFLLCGRLFVTLHPLNRIVITSIYGKKTTSVFYSSVFVLDSDDCLNQRGGEGCRYR